MVTKVNSFHVFFNNKISHKSRLENKIICILVMWQFRHNFFLHNIYLLATYFLPKILAHSPRKGHSHHRTLIHQVQNHLRIRLDLEKKFI